MKVHRLMGLAVGIMGFCIFTMAAYPQDEGWISLFDGNSLDGWKANENSSTFSVRDGMIVCKGLRSHLFYTGEVQNASFTNFELKADVLSKPGANSGIYIHTEFQDSGWPAKGYEIQINNTHIGEGNYRELKKTGSLYAIRNLYKTIVSDNEWFTITIQVTGKRIRVKLNDRKVVDYTEPESPARDGEYVGRILSRGTFALQGHDPGSTVFFKNIFIKPLSDDFADTEGQPPVADEINREIVRLNESNFPLIDFHIHLKGGLTLEEALALSQRNGINYGIAPNCGVGFPITNDEGIDQYLEQMKGQPIFIGMQAEGREWVTMFSREAISKFDYVFTDAMTFTDDQGRRTRLWINDEVHIEDKQAFMEMYVQKILGVLNDEPIDIYVNPTFLPEVIAAEYDQLWTEERMMKVINAAIKNHIAIEINNRYRLPSKKFIQLAKKAGVKFSIGTNNGDQELGRAEYALQMIRECKLTGDDMFMPRKK